MKKRKPSIYDPRYSELIQLLVKVRKNKAITQEELAGKLAISRQNISKIELGQRRLDVLELNDWVMAIGVKSSIIESLMQYLRKA